MSIARKSRPPIAGARLKTPATLLICKDCTHGSDVRRAIKHATKAGSHRRELRVIGCGCFDVCPKRGAAALLATAQRAARCIVIDPAATIDDAFVRGLLDERVRDSVSNEHGRLPFRLGLDDLG